MVRSLSATLFALVLSAPVLACAGQSARAAQTSPTHHGAAGSEPMAGKSATRDKKSSTATAEEPAKPAGASKAAAAASPSETGMTGDLASYEAFAKAVTAAKTDAERTARLFAQALVAYTRDYDIGLQMVSLLLRPTDLKVDEGSLSGFHPMTSVRDDLQQLDKKPDIIRGYCGGTPGKKYEDADLAGCPIVFDKQYSSRNQGIGYPSEGRAKFFIKNGGAPSPRPMELEFYENDRWLIRNFGGLLTGVARYDE